MTAITPQHAASGMVPTFQAAAAAGDTYPSTGNPRLHVLNSGPVAIALTIAAISGCSQGFTHPLTYTVPVGTVPWDLSAPGVANYSDGNGNVEVSYSTTVQPAPGAPTAWAITGIGP